MRTRRDQLVDAFCRYVEGNPEVWQLFKRFTLEVIRAGRSHMSADMICHRIRWFTNVEVEQTDPDGPGLKLSNNHVAYFARLFELRYPEYRGFFRCNELRSAFEPAHDNPSYGIAPPRGDESDLDAKLYRLIEPEMNPPSPTSFDQDQIELF